MSKIEWTDTTWNPVSGCTRASSGCDNCYAVTMTKRLEAMGQEKYSGLVNIGKDHFNGVVKCHEDELLKPLKWRKPRRVFVNSMSDLFHKGVPFEFIDKVFAVMALCPQHTFQILTKRPERMAEYCSRWDGDYILDLQSLMGSVGLPKNQTRIFDPENDPRYFDWPLPNVWLGTSVEDDLVAKERVNALIQCPASVRFLSCEPLIGDIDLNRVGWLHGLDGMFPGSIHWVIVGGESGPNARPCVIGHIRSIVKQCKAARVPVFVKQLGSNPTNREGEKHPIRDHHNINEFPEDLRVREWPNEGMLR